MVLTNELTFVLVLSLNGEGMVSGKVYATIGINQPINR